MTDPSRTSLPLQIAGFVLIALGCGFKNWPTAEIGLAMHFVGDVWFYFQIKARGCLNQ